MVAGPGTSHEQDAPFALKILVMSERILSFGSDRRTGRDHALLHADDGDGLELQALHAVHGPRADGALRALRGKRQSRDASGPQRFSRVLDHMTGPGGDTDGVGLDASVQPGTDLPGESG